MKRLLASAAAVTAPSRYLVQEMQPYRNEVRLLSNALNVGSYGFRLREQPAPRLVWFRAFHSIYNPALAPPVVALLAAKIPDVRLRMVGPDKRDGSRRRTEELAHRLGLNSRVEFVAGVPKKEAPTTLSAADVFLNTTNVDNTPVSVLEAMACGLCVVSTNVGGIPYLLKHEKDALLVPPNDPEAMAAAVRRTLTEPGLAARLSENARRKAEQFDWSIVLPQWEKLLMEVVERGRA